MHGAVHTTHILETWRIKLKLQNRLWGKQVVCGLGMKQASKITRSMMHNHLGRKPHTRASQRKPGPTPATAPADERQAALNEIRDGEVMQRGAAKYGAVRQHLARSSAKCNQGQGIRFPHFLAFNFARAAWTICSFWMRWQVFSTRSSTFEILPDHSFRRSL